MGNRIGIHAAMDLQPGAHIYFSSASQFSVKKTVGDCDYMSNRWKLDKQTRWAEIPADEYGRIVPEQLVRQVVSDLAECASRGQTYELILFANMGTTFLGGRDDILDIRTCLAKIGVRPSYIHVDGALDLGFSTNGVRMGPPRLAHTLDGVAIVQGVTISHHKACETMVSGDVIYYDPNGSDRMKLLTTSVDSRVVFEMWLVEQTYPPKVLQHLHKFCRENALLLRESLADANIPIRYNDNSVITILERPAPWILNDFGLAPEGDWVHFITMPHISPTTINRFVRDLTLIDAQCATALDYVNAAINVSLGQRTTLLRITPRSAIATSFIDIANTTLLKRPELKRLREEQNLSKPQDV